MTDYKAILQYVSGKVYELKGFDSAFHIHQPHSDTIAFYGPEHYHKELYVQLISGEKMIFEQVPEPVMASLEPEDADIDTIYQELSDAAHPKRTSNAALIPVDLREIVNIVCEMQYHITTTNGLWTTDVPDKFKDHPTYPLLWQIWFKSENGKFSSYASGTGAWSRW
jgi:hypothetical protein